MSKSSPASSSPSARVLLVAVDFSESSVRALDAALDLSASKGAPTVLHTLFVEEVPLDVIGSYALPPSPALPRDVERLKTLVLERIRAAIERHGTLPIHHAEAHGATGSPAREIAHLAAELGADLVLVGTAGRRGLERALLGSVAEKTVRLCGCPVLVVRAKSHAEVARVPEVEPICPECVDRRFQSKGAELWCARHSEHHPRAHVYSYESPSVDAARPWGFDS